MHRRAQRHSQHTPPAPKGGRLHGHVSMGRGGTEGVTKRLNVRRRTHEQRHRVVRRRSRDSTAMHPGACSPQLAAGACPEHNHGRPAHCCFGLPICSAVRPCACPPPPPQPLTAPTPTPPSPAHNSPPGMPSMYKMTLSSRVCSNQATPLLLTCRGAAQGAQGNRSFVPGWPPQGATNTSPTHALSLRRCQVPLPTALP